MRKLFLHGLFVAAMNFERDSSGFEVVRRAAKSSAHSLHRILDPLVVARAAEVKEQPPVDLLSEFPL
jgi:hypothetical protein